MSKELPDGVELPEIRDGLPRLLWDSVQGLNAEEDAGWSPDAHMHLRKLNSAVNMMREQGCLADREKQAARLPKFINEQEAINHYLLTAAPTEPSKPEQAEGLSDPWPSKDQIDLAHQDVNLFGRGFTVDGRRVSPERIVVIHPTTPPASAAGERDVFIAWVEKEHPEFSTEGHADGGFLWATTEGLWQAWQARAALASKPVAPPEREAPSIGQIIEVAESWQRGFMCPLCGHDQPHEHSPREITIYRNGVKWGLKNGTEQWPWKGYPSPSKNAGHDSKGVGRQGGHGTDQHHEHRVGQSGSDRAHDQSTGRRDGIHGACDVSAKVDATPPASAAGERDVTDAMVDAYLKANDAYWHRTDQLPKPPNKWRTGTPREAVRESLVAALASKPLPEQVAQDSEHAENYRLIRRGQHWSVVDGIGNTLRGDDLDAAVAAIRAARTRGEGGGT